MQITVKPQGWLGRFGDWLMLPLMYLVQGTVWEAPQRTHFWNNAKFKKTDLQDVFSGNDCLDFAGDESANHPYWFGIPRFHIPILGGWRTFVVLQAEGSAPYHIGWVASHGFVGISRVSLSGPVRMTIGPGNCTFFAIKRDGTRCRLKQVGEGLIGEAGEFRHVPLL